MRYSVQLRDGIFVKSYGFLPFAKSMGKNIGKNINKKLSGKYNQKIFDNSKNRRNNCYLIVNKIANKITEVSNNSQQNNLETVSNEHYK